MSKPLAAVDRPLALRVRADLQAASVEMSGTSTWIVKDPITLEHFQFSTSEYWIMGRLRGPVSIAELQRGFEREFAPQTISPQAVWDFLSRLHDAGLVISDASGQGHELLDRMRRDRRRRWAMSWTSLLAIRFRGFDPDALLTTIHARLGWMFSKAMAIPLIGLLMYAAWLVIGHFEEFRSRLPELAALADARNLPWLLLAIGGVKVLHELGHALACKHFGGEVRELGFMLLVFAPCLYCDVSDAWRLPSKWRRIAVSAAGIAVELVLAAVATIVWWYAQAGVVQLVALNVMIVCTLNTLLVNGNPLLRYDGYYILSDLTEMPNLWQRSREVLRRLTLDWLTGQPAADDPLVPSRRRSWLALYAGASKAYLVFVLVAIVWGLVQFLYPYHLQNLAYAAGLVVLGSTLASPIQQAAQIARNPARRRELRAGRIGLAAALVLAVTVGVLSLPVNYYVKAPLVLLPENAARVYAKIGGTLAEMLPAGTHVRRGAVIGRLINTDVELELARLEGEQRLRQLRIEHLERLRGLDREANDELPTARAALADTERRLDERRRESERLTLVAPADGVIIPAPRNPSPRHGSLQLATWTGSLLDDANRSAQVEPGTLVCLVGDPSQLTAVLLVNDSDIKRLQPAQRARLRLDQLPGRVIEGEVMDVAAYDVRNLDNEVAARADLTPLFVGLLSPEHHDAAYQVRVRLDRGARSEEREASDDDGIDSRLDPRSSSLVIGGRGQAKVAAERITLARRILRYAAQTFRLPM